MTAGTAEADVLPGSELARTPSPWSQRLLFVAIVTSPLQSAFSVTAVFDLKICEIFLAAAIVVAVLEPKVSPRRRFPEAGWFCFLLAWTVLSALISFLAAPPPEPAPGYTRALEVDTLLYVAYAALVLGGAAVVARGRFEILTRALIAATWVSFAMVAVQFVLFQSGQTGLLETLGFQTERVGTGFGVEVLRTGSFVEGQHLGFFSAVMLIVCLWQRRFVTAAAALAALIYSQSTSAIIALLLSAFVVALTRPRASTTLRLFAGVGVLAAAIAIIEPLRSYVLFQLAKLGVAGASELANERSVTLRGDKSSLALDMAFANPVFGLGPGRFGAWFATYAQDGGYQFPPVYYNQVNRPIVENGYAQLAAENGLPALIALLVAFALILRIAYRHSGWALGIALVLVVSFWTMSSWTFIPAWIVVGFLSSLRYFHDTKHEQAAPDRRPRRTR